MKRTPLRRKTPMRRVSARKRGEKQAEAAFRRAVLQRAGGRCERCDAKADLDAHHLVSRGRGRGAAWLHDPSNGAALCRRCHRAVHDATAEDWRAWVLRAPPARA